MKFGFLKTVRGFVSSALAVAKSGETVVPQAVKPAVSTAFVVQETVRSDSGPVCAVVMPTAKGQPRWKQTPKDRRVCASEKQAQKATRQAARRARRAARKANAK